MTNKYRIVVTEHPEDICECGDFRRQHDDKGHCKLCSWSRPPGTDACTKFRKVAPAAKDAPMTQQPDTVCRNCGHSKYDHTDTWEDHCIVRGCDCEKFAFPEPSPDAGQTKEQQ